MKKLSYLLVLLCLISLTSCKKTEIVLEKTSTELFIGETYKITPSLSKDKKDASFEFTSSNTAVAEVSSDGVIVTKAQGSATITVAYKDVSATFLVTVKEQQKATYKLIFKVDGNVYSEYSFVEGATISWPSVTDPTKAGYMFTGWDNDVILVMPSNDVVYNATFSKLPVIYTVEFILDPNSTEIGPNPIPSQVIEEGSLVSKPTDPTKEGYNFVGWMLDGELFDFETPINKSIKLVASFEEIVVLPTTYTVTFDTAGGSPIDPQTVVEGEKAVPPTNPTKAGYEFLAWLNGNVEYDFNTLVNENVTLVATWKQLPDETAPVISLKENANLKYVVYIGETYNLLEDVIAIDDIDGDVSLKIQIEFGKFNDKVNGTYEITYKVSDSSGNECKYVRRVAVMEKKQSVMFIGHAGCYSGLENTETAFIAAATEKQYDAMEADLRQTKDGVFVLEHDEEFAGLTLASTNWADLKDVEYTAKRGGISYTTKICTLDRYFEICKQYNKKAVIELKWSNGINNNDQSRMGALMQAIKDADMLDSVIFLASQYKCLEWVRNNGYKDIPCQYLVNSIESDTYFERCTTWGFDISFNISYTNTKAWIEKYQAAGVNVACYTFSQYSSASDLQKWLDMGVDAVTCDVLTRNDVRVPEIDNSDDYTYEYKVVFKDINGNIIDEVFVKEGRDCLAPSAPTINGATFVRWNKTLTNVRSDLEVEPIYEETVYNITYDANIKTVTESTWSSKDEFVTEFYTDLFNFFKDNVNNISALTLSNGVYTLKVNSTTYGTATWSTVEELKAVNIYNFEQTVGLYIYKPITGTNSSDYVPEADEGYFLNSDKYRTKYQALNAYFLNAIVNNYTSYNTGYKPTSAGKVQIFFRFHQWQQGTNIPQFNTLPKKYIVDETTTNITMPNNPVTYTVSTDTITLLNPECDGYTFLGWYLNGQVITEIAKGTTGNIILTAKWQKNE